MKRQLIIGTLGLLWAVSPGWAGDIGFPEGEMLLINHVPHNIGGLASDTLFSAVPGGEPFPWQLVADDFRLDQAESIGRIVYWGFYDSNISPTTDETMRIRFYDGTEGLPGEVLHEASFLNPPREWTGRNVDVAGGGPELRFEAFLDPPFSAVANTTYWFEVAQIGDLSSAYRAEFGGSSPLNGQVKSNPANPNWIYTSGFINNAFQLYSVPEPTSLSLVILSALAISHRNVRRIGWE